jgi:uncharacterized protein (TIGR00369 family)
VQADIMTAEIFDRFPRPPIADLLGWEIVDADAERGWIKIAFQTRPEFLNPAGYVQGGILAAMLDDTMGPAALLTSGGERYTATIDMTVSFLAPAAAGRIIGEGRVVRLGKTIGFLEATLSDASGALVARATSSARLIPTAKLPA